MAADPADVVVALRAALPEAFSVRLDQMEGRPYAVVQRPGDDETWIDLLASIGGNSPHADPPEIAAAIIHYEGWPGGFAFDRQDIRRAYRPVMDDVRRTLDVQLDLDFDPELDISWSLPGVIIRLNGESIVTCHDLKPEPADQIVAAAREVQEVIVDGNEVLPGRRWPVCPSHPDEHPMSAVRHDLGPAWVCPSTGQPAFAIGALGAYGGTTAT